jgi:hypothetical protein
MTEQQTEEVVERRPEWGDRRGRLIAGGSLMIAGLGLFALEAVDGTGDAAILFVIGAVFIAAYFMRKVYGFLIAGCIALGVGLGQAGQEIFDTSGDVTVIGIGLGFGLIYAIDRLTDGSAHWWPLIPGGILLIIGLASLSGSVGDYLWPALLIVAGGVVLFSSRRRETG